MFPTQEEDYSNLRIAGLATVLKQHAEVENFPALLDELENAIRAFLKA